MSHRFCNIHSEHYDDDSYPFFCSTCLAISSGNRRDWAARGRSRGNGEYGNLILWSIVLTIEVAYLVAMMVYGLGSKHPADYWSPGYIFAFFAGLAMYIGILIYPTYRQIRKWVRYEI